MFKMCCKMLVINVYYYTICKVPHRTIRKMKNICDGRCCRHSAQRAIKLMRDHSRQHAATRFYLANKTSTPTMDTHSQTYTLNVGHKESKQMVQLIHFCKQLTQQILCFLGPLQLQISWQLYNQLNKLSNQSLNNYLLKGVNRIYKDKIII